MKNLVFLILTALTLISCHEQRLDNADYPYQPISFTNVQFTDSFWLPRIETNRLTTIPYAFKKCEETGRVKNLQLAGEVNAGKIKSGKFCTVFPFDDSDIYKIVEGAAYSLNTKPDPQLDKYLDSMAVIIAAAQEKDGYLYSNRTMDPEHTHSWAGKDRWVNDRLNSSHELYNMGHFYEAAVAHYYATGKRNYLDIAVKNADLLCKTFGPYKMRTAPGHQVIEMGLAKLYRMTGEKKYLDLAKFFLEQRGRLEPKGSDYNQDHMPVVNQSEGIGHAVRAGYLYAGMADVAAISNDTAYVSALNRIWDNVVSKKLYITGGIGARHEGEAFSSNYDLPNLTAYNETCAAIANVFWNYRMFLLHGDAKYIDVLERSLYNAVISGISLDGTKFFYPNPLEADGNFIFNQGALCRKEWFDCSCCPSNIARFIPSLTGYVYAKQSDSLFINLFVSSKAHFDFAGQKIQLEQETKYPWDGNIKVVIHPEKEAEWVLAVRIPGWATNSPVPSDLYRFIDENKENPKISVNAREQQLNLHKGYALIKKSWKDGDIVEIKLPMPVRKIAANQNVKEDKGRISLQRGPLVYCAEAVDNNGKALNIIIPENTIFESEFRNKLLNGIEVVKGEALIQYFNDKTKTYETKKQELTAIPYYAWNHRGIGEMEVWFNSDKKVYNPEINPITNLFIGKLNVYISGHFDEDIYYTKDGSKPGKNSILYKGPFEITESTTIMALAINKENIESEVVKTTFAKTTYKDAVQAKNLKPGLKYEYFEGEWDKLPDFKTIKPLKSGESKNFNLKTSARSENYGLVLSGFIEIPANGIYKFFTISDDGSALYIDDNQLIDNDGIHGDIEKNGEMALKAGKHKIEVKFFQKGGGQSLKVFMEGPGIKKQEILAGILFYN